MYRACKDELICGTNFRVCENLSLWIVTYHIRGHLITLR